MERRVSTEASTKASRLLSIMTMFSSLVTLESSIELAGRVVPARFEGLGFISPETISMFLLQVKVLSVIAIALSMFYLLDGFKVVGKLKRYASWASIAIGTALSLEGIAAINLRSSMNMVRPPQ